MKAPSNLCWAREKRHIMILAVHFAKSILTTKFKSDHFVNVTMLIPDIETI